MISALQPERPAAECVAGLRAAVTAVAAQRAVVTARCCSAWQSHCVLLRRRAGTCPDYRYTYDGSAPSASRLIDACEEMVSDAREVW